MGSGREGTREHVREKASWNVVILRPWNRKIRTGTGKRVEANTAATRILTMGTVVVRCVTCLTARNRK